MELVMSQLTVWGHHRSCHEGAADWRGDQWGQGRAFDDDWLRRRPDNLHLAGFPHYSLLAQPLCILALHPSLLSLPAHSQFPHPFLRLSLDQVLNPANIRLGALLRRLFCVVALVKDLQYFS